jgi:hypothetical protein
VEVRFLSTAPIPLFDASFRPAVAVLPASRPFFWLEIRPEQGFSGASAEPVVAGRARQSRTAYLAPIAAPLLAALPQLEAL